MEKVEDRRLKVLNVASRSDVENMLKHQKKAYGSVNLSKLPDKGARLKSKIDDLEDLLKSMTIASDEKRSNDTVVAKPGNDSEKSRVQDKITIKSDVRDDKDKCPPNLHLKNVTNVHNLSFEELSKKAPKSDPVSTPKTEAFTKYRNPNERCVQVIEAKRLEHHQKETIPRKNFHSVAEQVPQVKVSNKETLCKLHETLNTCPLEMDEELPSENLKTPLLKHQRRALSWLVWRENQIPSGGILADDMGLGKTLTMLSLVAKQLKSIDSDQSEATKVKGTLIVCVASVIHQWEEEVKKHFEDRSLSTLLYHGPDRDKKCKILDIQRYDIIITTYNIVQIEFKALNTKDKKSMLFDYNWERIILDEAHTIKNHTSLTAEAIFNLKANRRWAVTGTPIHNNFKDMYSLLKFLCYEPFNDFKTWKKLINDETRSSNERRNLLVKSILLRRTKDQIDETGEAIVNLPQKNVLIRYIELSDQERKIYNQVYEKARMKMDKYFSSEKCKDPTESLLTLLLRLQQCCSHTSLLNRDVDDDKSLASVSDLVENLSSLDITKEAGDSGLSFDDFLTEDVNDPEFKSTKLKNLLNELDKIPTSDKCVIVSQWVSMLKIVAMHLSTKAVSFHMIIGSTKVEDRQKSAQDFNYNPDGPKVLLLSLKAGGIGLNLIGGNHLFLLDLHWNPALELQACDRIYRVQQTKDVFIYKFVCKATIEEKILSLQDEKSKMASSVLCNAKQRVKHISFEDFKQLFNINT